MDKLKNVLDTLNPQQRQSVESPPDGPLQILAGPGSGKTKVLTSRIAHLILANAIPPWNICAVTFTNEAANEMKERLQKLISHRNTKQLKMGTFHSLCAKLLRKHGGLVSLEENFTICDADESEKLVGSLLKPHRDVLEKNRLTTDRKQWHGWISKAKGKGFGADEYLADCIEKRKQWAKKAAEKGRGPPPDGHIVPDFRTKMLVQIFREYDLTLRRNNSLDFDDLLIYGVELVKKNKKVVRWCQHVLVDEFQDTNTMQYDLMKYIAAAHDHVTVVGDPDQSIYGWRSADVTNLKHMLKDFPRTKQIFLEQNYRSTASILDLSLAIISQDKSRVQKSLHTEHPIGPRPMLCCVQSDHAEALLIAAEIKRLVAAGGGLLKWEDFAILLRFNALSRNIEAALQIQGIPYRVLKGAKFFERAEIKDLLAYLQVVDNGKYLPAFMRTVNLPHRGLGEKSVAQIVARAEHEKLSPLDVIERIYDGKMPDNKPGIRKKIVSYVKIIRTLRKYANQGMGPADLLRQLLDISGYREYLSKKPDYDMRLENVDELITFAAEQQESIEHVEADAFQIRTGAIEDANSTSSNGSKPNSAKASSSKMRAPELEVIKISDDEDERPVPAHSRSLQLKRSRIEEVILSSRSLSDKAKGKRKADDFESDDEPVDKSKVTPLRAFLEASMLSTDTGGDGDEESKNRVTLSTCHSAKGLEWPVVFVPAVETDIFPFKRAEDIAEERRLLYVACTRAQGLLYVTHARKRMHAGKEEDRELSRFILFAVRDDKRLMTPELPQMHATNREVLSTVLRRPQPDAVIAERMQAEYDASPLKERLIDVIATNHPWPDPYTKFKDQDLEGFQSVRGLQGFGVVSVPYEPALPFEAAMTQTSGPSNPQHQSTTAVGFSGVRGVLRPAIPPRMNGQPGLPPDMHISQETYAIDAALGTQTSAPVETYMEPSFSFDLTEFSPSPPPIPSHPDSQNIPVASSSKLPADPAPRKRQTLPSVFENSPPILTPILSASPTRFRSSPVPLPTSPPPASRSSRRTPSRLISTSPAVKRTPLYFMPASSPGPSTSVSSSKVASAKAAECTSKSQPISTPPKISWTSVTIPVSASTIRPAASTGSKRRLGMGRPTMGYPNKKFKTPGT